jgi:uroporphyrinogen-III decarboxylase
MNHVERFRAAMNFEPVDRLPRVEWASYWDQTVTRWQGEGLPASLDRSEMGDYFGLDPWRQFWIRPYPPSCLDGVPHGQGIVGGMDDYAKLVPGLFGPIDGVLDGLRRLAGQQREGQAVIWLTLEGFFWLPRTLMGIERHIYAFYDQPELMHRINQDLADFHLRCLREVAEICPPAWMTFAEDMSYNLGPMLSREMFDEFLAPYYRRVIPALEEMGTTVIVDTDGDVTAMIPWLESVGIDGVLPLERQAAVDANLLRQRHPRLRMIGHFDKMVMDRGEAAMRVEFERLLPVMKSGGFIPSVDHQTPPGVSLEQYRCYLKLLWEYTGRAAS